MNNWYDRYEEAHEDDGTPNVMLRYTEEQIKYFENKLDSIAKTIAYPHTTIVENDRLKALVVINKLSNDVNLSEYLSSKLTIIDREKIKRIP